jgi:hypothetical protein
MTPLSWQHHVNHLRHGTHAWHAVARYWRAIATQHSKCMNAKAVAAVHRKYRSLARRTIEPSASCHLTAVCGTALSQRGWKYVIRARRRRPTHYFRSGQKRHYKSDLAHLGLDPIKNTLTMIDTDFRYSDDSGDSAFAILARFDRTESATTLTTRGTVKICRLCTRVGISRVQFTLQRLKDERVHSRFAASIVLAACPLQYFIFSSRFRYFASTLQRKCGGVTTPGPRGARALYELAPHTVDKSCSAPASASSIA